MSARGKRLMRVQAVRQEALDREQGALGGAMRELEVARAELTAAQRRVDAARAERLRLSGHVSIDDWRAKEAWLADLAKRVELARARVSECESNVEAARARVTVAKMELEQMSTLLESVHQEDAKAEHARERRDDDELASGRWLAAKS